MPLYLDDFEPPDVPVAYLQALLRIAGATSDQPVNPAAAANLLRAHLMPLVPSQHQPLFSLGGGQPSWGCLYGLYAGLAGESGGKDTDLIAAAILVDVVIRHSTRPPREMSFPSHLEVASFQRVAAYLGLPVQRPIVKMRGKHVCLYDFCRYCWLPADIKGVCLHHGTRSAEAPGTLCGTATRKQVQRLAPSFNKELTRVVSAQEWEFHESNFTSATLLPPSGLGDWLTQRRPALAEALTSHPHNPARTLEALLTLLYGPAAEDVLASVAASVHVLTPITFRAEAWCTAWNTRPQWGGRRPGAGRRT